MTTPGIGHNQGPTLEPGVAWRRTCWTKARAELLGPRLPIEVLRLRLRRAGELGLDYRAYASIRAATGQDVVAILFSTNALRLLKARAADPERVAAVARVQGAAPEGLAIRPVTVDAALAAVPVLSAAHPAPEPFARWSEARAVLRAACGKRPGDTVLLIGETAMEADWARAGGLAKFLPGDRYFGTSA